MLKGFKLKHYNVNQLYFLLIGSYLKFFVSMKYYSCIWVHIFYDFTGRQKRIQPLYTVMVFLSSA